MGALSTIGGIAALLTSGTVLLRRRISRNWISFSSTNYTNLTQDHVCIITGSNVGLGYETARDLARRGGTIVLACRDLELGNRAASKIRTSTGNKNVECLHLDLASLNSVRKFSAEFIKRYGGVYTLICNAGVWVPMENRRKTEDGFEIHFGVNHLGHFLLLQLLIPHIQTSGRIVLVSSGLCKGGKIDMKKKDFIYDGRRLETDKKAISFAPTGYCDSKLMNTLTCRQLDVQLQGSDVTTYAVCPGFCRSNLGRQVQMPFYKKIFLWPLMKLIQRSPAQGAQNIIFAAVEDKEKLVSGAMYKDGKIAEEETRFVDGLGKDLQKQLWDLSEKLIEEKKAI